MTRLGPTNYLVIARKAGLPELSIVCTRVAYRRIDGSVFIINSDGKRRTLTPCKPVLDPVWPYEYTLTIDCAD